MPEIHLAYGREAVRLEWDSQRFDVISSEQTSRPPLTDFEVGASLDSPVGSPPLDEIIDGDDSVLVVVSDATRATGSAQVVNLLVRRLVEIGVSPSRMAVL